MFRKSMNIFMNLFSTIEKASNIYLKTLVISFKNPAFTYFQILFYAFNMFFTLILRFFFIYASSMFLTLILRSLSIF